MSRYFLTHVEPLHPLKGKEALFFIREQSEQGNRSHVLIKEIPHYFFTRNMELREASLFLEYLEHEPVLQHLAFTQHPYNWSKHFLRAEGSKEDRFLLPEPFLSKGLLGNNDPVALNSPARQLRWLYPPLMLLEAPTEEAIPHPEDILHGRHRHQYASVEDILNDSLAIFDIEVQGWQEGKDRIYLAVYRCPAKERQVIFHDFSFSEEEYKGHRLLRYATQEELGELLTAQVHADDPLWEAGHNIMNYDRIKVRNLTEAYFPATNRHYPITKSAQGLGRVLTKGRFTIDTYTYMFNYFNIFADNKLSTLAQFEKSISYEEMDVLEEKAREGDRGAFHALLEYLVEDGVRTLHVGEQLKQRAALKVHTFHRDADSICSTGKATLGEEYWKRRHIFVKKTYADGWRNWREDEEVFPIDKFAHQHLLSGFEQGFFEGISVVYMAPFVEGFLPLLNKSASEVLYAFRKAQDPLEKFDLLQTLNAQASFFVEEMDDLFSRHGHHFIPPLLSQKEERALYAVFTNYGSGLDYQDILEGITEALKQSNDFLRRYEIVNRGRNLYFLRGTVTPGELETKFLGCFLGKGQALSLRPERVVGNPFQEKKYNRLVFQGFSATMGEKTEFEKRVLRTAVKDIFAGNPFRGIAAFLEHEQKSFIAGEKPRKEYFIRQKTRTYHRNLLDAILERRADDGKSPVTRNIAAEYRSLKHRIHDRYSDETRKELGELISQCRKDFSYQYILEIMEKIEHPFPSHVSLVFPLFGLQRGELMPEHLAHRLDLAQYREKVEEQFKDFYEVLQPRQLQLVPLGPSVKRPRRKRNKKKEAHGKQEQLVFKG